MGYYTYYNLDVSTVKDDNSTSFTTTNEISPLIRKTLEDEVDKMGVFEVGCCEDGWSGEAKWYDHEDDMLILSQRFPELLFELSGEGEESGDMWHKYFHNGAIQECYAEIVYPEFDPAKMVVCPVDSEKAYSYQQ